MWTVARDGILTVAEGRGLTALGLSPQELIGRTIEDVYSRIPQVLVHYKRAFGGATAEATIETAGPTLQAHLVPLESEDGTIEGVVGVATDITDLTHAQVALSETEARHTVVLDALHEGVLLVDRLGRVLDANPAAQRILAPGGDALLGSTIGDPGW